MAQKWTSTVSFFQCIFRLSGLLNILLEKRLLYTNCLHSITSVLKADLKYLAQYSYANCLTFESLLCKDSIFIKKKKTLSAAILFSVTTFCFVIEKIISVVNNSMHAFALPFRFVSVYDPFGIHLKNKTF